MKIPLNYIARNLAARKLTTLLTAGGMALVVFVFTAVLMLSAGLEKTMVATGRDDNVIAIRRASQTEVQSSVDRASASIIESVPGIAAGPDGMPLSSREPVVLINLPKRDSGKPSNVAIRGVTAQGLELRPQVRIVQGRMFTPGTSEIVAGRAVAGGFRHAGLGESLRFAQRDWTVVGIFDAGRSGFDSEVWGDAEQMMQAFRRQSFSAVVFRLVDESRFDAVKAALESDPRLTVEVKRESRFYAEQSEALAKFINYLGVSISVIFSIGAVIGAMITMYASVASRTGEIGTLRALGFPRRSILAAFMVESLLLGLVGGVAGIVAASFMQALSISTTNFQTFAEVAFSFALTANIVAAAVLFSLLMGFVGGFLPAARAARMKIVDALRGMTATRALLLMATCTLIWGSTWFAITWQLGTVAPEVSVALRFALAAALLAAVCAVRRYSLRLARREHALLAAQGACMFALSYVLLYYAEQHIVSGLVAVVFATYALMNVFAERVVAGTKVTVRAVVAAMVSVTGVALLCLPAGGVADGVARTSVTAAAGIAIALAATLSSTIGAMAAARLQRRGVAIVPATTWALAWGAAMTAAWAVALGRSWALDMRLPYLASLLYLAVFGTVVAFVAYLTLMRGVGMTRASYVGVTTPVIAMLLSTMLEGYRWTWTAFAGVVLAIGGNVLASRAPRSGA